MITLNLKNVQNFSNNLKIIKKVPNILPASKSFGEIKPAKLVRTPVSDAFEKSISREQAFWKNFGFTLPMKDKDLEEFSEIIHGICDGIFEYELTPTLKAQFADTNAKFSGRLKEASSILPKFQRRQESLEKCSNLSDVFSEVSDLCGFKLTTKGSEQEGSEIVQKIAGLIDEGKFEPTHIINRGKTPYLNDEQLTALSKKGFHIVQPKNASNFNCSSVYFRDAKYGVPIELQIMGDKTDKINAKEHIFYNYKTKGGATENGVVNEKFQKAFDSMTSDEINQYQKYIDDCYTFARAKELNVDGIKKPLLPDNMDEILRMV